MNSTKLPSMMDDAAQENPDKSLANRTAQAADYDLQTKFKPNGDQPAAISELLDGVGNDERDQVLLGLQVRAKLSQSHMLLRNQSALP